MVLYELARRKQEALNRIGAAMGKLYEGREEEPAKAETFGIKDAATLELFQLENIAVNLEALTAEPQPEEEAPKRGRKAKTDKEE